MATAPAEYPKEINLFTLNCWGLKFLSALRHERLEAIGAEISKADPFPDIVCLQECWTGQDYECIRDQLAARLPYGKFYHSGIFGGGLAIFSRWPLEESNMVRYPLNGRPTAVFRGDWFVGKGVACAKIRIGPAKDDILEVFNTHLHAPYESGHPTDSYICHRVAQAWEIARLMRDTASRKHLVVALGDFNMLPLSLEHRIIESHGGACDTWRLLHPDSSLGPVHHPVEAKRRQPVPSAKFNLLENGAASDNVINTWRMTAKNRKRISRGLPVDIGDDTPDPGAKRLDYIFVSTNADKGKPWVVQTARVGMTAWHPTLRCSLSDHFSVEVTLSREENMDAAPAHSSTDLEFDSNSSRLPLSCYQDIANLIHTYRLREERQRRWRLMHLVISVPISIGCLVAIWWSPRNYVSFILLLLSTVSLSTGIVDGLIGGLFVNSELRALKEFEWEIQNARQLVTEASDTSDEKSAKR